VLTSVLTISHDHLTALVIGAFCICIWRWASQSAIAFAIVKFCRQLQQVHMKHNVWTSCGMFVIRQRCFRRGSSKRCYVNDTAQAMEIWTDLRHDLAFSLFQNRDGVSAKLIRSGGETSEMVSQTTCVSVLLGNASWVYHSLVMPTRMQLL
jgi:hypothetical protein